jgi:hypothetical protein
VQGEEGNLLHEEQGEGGKALEKAGMMESRGNSKRREKRTKL